MIGKGELKKGELPFLNGEFLLYLKQDARTVGPLTIKKSNKYEGYFKSFSDKFPLPRKGSIYAVKKIR